MKRFSESGDLASMLREAAQAVEERPQILAELDRLREVESAAMKVCTQYLFQNSSHRGKVEDDFDDKERVRGIKEEVKNLHVCIQEGRKRISGLGR